MSKLDIKHLLASMQSLLHRMAHLNMRSRIDSYQGKQGYTEVQDISKPLSEQIDELARNAQNDVTPPLGSADTDPLELKESTSESNVNRRQPRAQTIRGRLNALSKLFKGGSSSVVVQPHLSEQLQRSVREHLNISLRNARQGDTTNAKLHADLACNALHELSHYMPEEDFTQFNAQVIADLQEFRDRDIFKPLTKMTN